MKRLLRIILAVWILVWILFLVRPYFRIGLFKTYKELIPLSAEEKYAYLIGREFYDFLRSCKKSIPSGSTYTLVGFKKDSLEARRAVYYMYPDIPSSDPEFILVYMTKHAPEQGYEVFRQLGPDKYLLRKTV